MFRSLAGGMHLHKRSRSWNAAMKKGNIVVNKIRIFAVLSMVTLGTIFTATARADGDDFNKLTKVTVSEPIAVSGTVLQPGSYWFVLVDHPTTRHTVQIMNLRRDHVFATVNAFNVYRPQTSGKTEFTFYETPAGQPLAMKDWFYPGDDYGQQFINRSQPVQISQVSQPAIQTRPIEQAPAVTAEPAPASEPPAPVIAQNEPPAAAPPAPEPETAPAPAPAVLPQTASDIPLLTLIGLLSLAAAAGLGAAVKKVG
jgi:hypothetical protein